MLLCTNQDRFQKPVLINNSLLPLRVEFWNFTYQCKILAQKLTYEEFVFNCYPFRFHLFVQ